MPLKEKEVSKKIADIKKRKKKKGFLSKITPFHKKKATIDEEELKQLIIKKAIKFKELTGRKADG